MGTGVKCHCKCGYQGEASIGSTRAGHGKYFGLPHWCADCNEVVTLDLLAMNQACNKCGGVNLQSYEAKTTRRPFKYPELAGLKGKLKFGWHAYEDELSRSWCYNLKKDFVILRGANYCPKCRANTLTFHTHLYFD